MKRRVLASLVLLLLAGACTMPKKFSNIGSDTQIHQPGPPYYPIGLERRDTRERGLYYSEVEHDSLCCWLSTDANVEVVKHGPAQNALITLLVPGFQFFVKDGQTVTIVLDGRSLTTHLDAGEHTLAIDLGRLRDFNGPVPIAIRSARVFVPKHEGVNADERALGIVLVGVAFH